MGFVVLLTCLVVDVLVGMAVVVVLVVLVVMISLLSFLYVFVLVVVAMADQRCHRFLSYVDLSP